MLIQSPGSTKSNFRGFSKEEQNTTNDKMEQQQQQLQHIKRLLTTAGSAAGLLGDLDAPAVNAFTTTTPATPHSLGMPARKGERNLWRLEEIKEMLTIMQELNALDLLNDKMVKSETVFYDIEKLMIRRGYNKKTHNQIWTKWKFLKSTYMTSRRNGVIPKMIPGEIYLILHKMLGNGSDLVNSLEDSSNAPSLDGDNSVMDEDMDSSPPMDILNGKHAKHHAFAEKDDAFGMAHPIFGFRLGMVKSEPADTGYETTANNSVISENDSLENNAIYPVGLSPQNSQDLKANAQERVTASPPEPMLSSSPTSPDNSLLIPRETAAMSMRPLAVKQKITPQRLPPQSNSLRIANFAKESNNLDTKESASSTFCTKEISSSKNGSVIAVSPAITIPSSLERGSIVRLPRDVTLQLRSKYATQIQQQPPKNLLPPTSATAYALRGDETYAPNRNQPKNQHSQPQQQQHEQPMTSQMAKLRASILNKKRRLEIPNWDTSDAPLPSKITRFANPSSMPHNVHIRNHSFPTNKNRYLSGNDVDDDDDDDGNDDELKDFSFPNFIEPASSSYNTTAAFQRSRAYEQHFTPIPASTTKQKGKFTSTPTSTTVPPMPNIQQPQPQDFTKRSPMEEILKDMAMSLRQSQLQMVNEFFEQQMELVRKDHEFQMEQDRLLMAAFKQQTQRLMQAAQEMFDTSAVKQNKMRKNFNNKQKSNKNFENHKTTTTTNTRAQPDQDELSTSDSDGEAELQENGESDPLLSFDPTQFVSSELVESNDENDDDGEKI